MAEGTIQIEVAFGTPTKQSVVSVELPQGATLESAVTASGLAGVYPEYNFATLKKGVWSEVKSSDHLLKDGDRVEIYRPLTTDPKEARRRRAEKKQG